MRRIQHIIFALLISLLFGCSEDNDNNGELVWRYAGTDTILVQDKKEYTVYPGTSIPTKEKWYVITDRQGRTFDIQFIEGFDDIYKEGTSYLIVVQLSLPTVQWLDQFGYKYKFVKILEEKKS